MGVLEWDMLGAFYTLLAVLCLVLLAAIVAIIILVFRR